jgi:hypothetical protein
MSASEPFRETYAFGQPIQRFLYKPIEAIPGGGCHAEVHLPPATVARPPTGFPVGSSTFPSLKSAAMSS